MITELLKTFAERLFGMSISQDAQSIMYFTIYGIIRTSSLSWTS